MCKFFLTLNRDITSPRSSLGHLNKQWQAKDSIQSNVQIFHLYWSRCRIRRRRGMGNLSTWKELPLRFAPHITFDCNLTSLSFPSPPFAVRTTYHQHLFLFRNHSPSTFHSPVKASQSDLIFLYSSTASSSLLGTLFSCHDCCSRKSNKNLLPPARVCLRSRRICRRLDRNQSTDRTNGRKLKQFYHTKQPPFEYWFPSN